MTEIILNARWLIAGIDDVGSVELYENAGLVFKNNMILDLGHFGDIKSKYPNAKVKSYLKHAIIPGLVNSHHHLGLTPLQLGAPDYALELWFAARLAMRKVNPYLDTMFLR